MTELRQKMIRAMDLKNLSHHTQRAYLASVKGIAKHYGHPICCKTHLRPAGLSFSRAGFSPAGRLTEFPEVSPPPFQRTSIDWSLLLQNL